MAWCPGDDAVSTDADGFSELVTDLSIAGGQFCAFYPEGFFALEDVRCTEGIVADATVSGTNDSGVPTDGDGIAELVSFLCISGNHLPENGISFLCPNVLFSLKDVSGPLFAIIGCPNNGEVSTNGDGKTESVSELCIVAGQFCLLCPVILAPRENVHGTRIFAFGIAPKCSGDDGISTNGDGISEPFKGVGIISVEFCLLGPICAVPHEYRDCSCIGKGLITLVGTDDGGIAVNSDGKSKHISYLCAPWEEFYLLGPTIWVAHKDIC